MDSAKSLRLHSSKPRCRVDLVDLINKSGALPRRTSVDIQHACGWLVSWMAEKLSQGVSLHMKSFGHLVVAKVNARRITTPKGKVCDVKERYTVRLRRQPAGVRCLKRADIEAAIVKGLQYKKKEASALWSEWLNFLSDSLLSLHPVQLRGFGVFHVHRRPEGERKNLHTGKMVRAPEKLYFKFSPSDKLNINPQ